jgi:hypothetical protein
MDALPTQQEQLWSIEVAGQRVGPHPTSEVVRRLVLKPLPVDAIATMVATGESKRIYRWREFSHLSPGRIGPLAAVSVVLLLVLGVGVVVALQRPSEPHETTAVFAASATATTKKEPSPSVELACFDSGICDEDMVEALVEATSDDAERSRIQAFVKRHEAEGLRRVWSEVLLAKEHLKSALAHKQKGAAYFDTSACIHAMKSGRSLLYRASNGAKRMALSIPGSADLRGALVHVSGCWSCDANMVDCNDALTTLSYAEADLRKARAHELGPAD